MLTSFRRPLVYKFTTDQCGRELFHLSRSSECWYYRHRLSIDPDLIRSCRHYARNTAAVTLNNAIRRYPGALRAIGVPYTRRVLTKEYPVISHLTRRHLPDSRRAGWCLIAGRIGQSDRSAGRSIDRSVGGRTRPSIPGCNLTRDAEGRGEEDA